MFIRRKYTLPSIFTKLGERLYNNISTDLTRSSLRALNAVRTQCL
jgi:hypothetical protein